MELILSLVGGWLPDEFYCHYSPMIKVHFGNLLFLRPALAVSTGCFGFGVPPSWPWRK